MAKIFYVEDDTNLGFVVKDCLENKNHTVDHFKDGGLALDAYKVNEYDICLLDVMLPTIDGFTIAKKIRSLDLSVPIIFISAKIQLEDKLEGLSLGADDYIFKPFSLEELLLKINIFVKRKGIKITEEVNILNFGKFELDRNNLLLKFETEHIKLTVREADLIAYFVLNKNKLCKREEILIALWGQDDYFLGRSLDVFISRIRKYFALDQDLKLENIPKVGFRLEVK
jgi:DNA-binding response OmpR family regulator